MKDRMKQIQTEKSIAADSEKMDGNSRKNSKSKDFFGEINWKRKPYGESLAFCRMADVPLLRFPALDETGIVSHAFSTRMGGVSEGKFAAMNFSFTRGDRPEHVMENYRRMAAALGMDHTRMVLSYQTHTTHVRAVTEADAGKGVVRERDYRDVDGLITNVPGITLVTFYADCVPLYLVDPVRKAIGLSHSGWRGTVNRMGQKTIEAMSRTYGTRPEDLIVCIGPSICQDCYEVGEEVAKEFKTAFPGPSGEKLLRAKGGEKYQLDLWAANRLIFEEAKIPPTQIHTTDICTHCNSEYLFSHRTMGDERGNLAAFLALSL